MTRGFILMNTAAIAVAGAIGFGALHFLQRPGAPAAARAADANQVPLAVGGPFDLVDQRGRRVTDKDFRGRYMLVFFGFTYCPDVCPTGLYSAAQALRLLGDAGKTVAPIFVTVDPERDTPAVLARYLANFDPRLTGLTGSAAAIKAAADAYRVAYGRVEGDGDPYLMYHTALFYLMGPDGTYRVHFRHSDPPERMAEIMRQHIEH